MGIGSDPPTRSTGAVTPVSTESGRIKLIRSVETPLSFFVLMLIVVEAVFGVVAGLLSGPERTYVIIGMGTVLILLLGIVALFAWLRPEALVGKRPETAANAPDVKGSKPSPRVRGGRARLPHVSEVYLRRQEIHWNDYNGKVKRRFWAVGTSLIGVYERKLLNKYAAAGVSDIRILLPSTVTCHCSFLQLDQYDHYNRRVRSTVDNQVRAAAEAFESFRARGTGQTSLPLDAVVHRYSGIMYYNITIFDDDAFVSPYDSTGVGDNNLVLHFYRPTNPDGYRFAEEEFCRMWDADPHVGAYPAKAGAGILFLNHRRQVLLFLRDNKVGIPYPNRWDILGGNMKPGETPVECLTREMREEIEYTVINPVPYSQYYSVADQTHQFIYWEQVDFEPDQLVLHEGQRLKWFTLDELEAMPDDDFAFAFANTIRGFLRNPPVS